MKLRLVDNWREWHRWGSMKLGATAAAALAFATGNPQIFVQAASILPEDQRLRALLVFGGCFAVIWFARTTKLEKGGKDACDSSE